MTEDKTKAELCVIIVDLVRERDAYKKAFAKVLQWYCNINDNESKETNNIKQGETK